MDELVVVQHDADMRRTSGIRVFEEDDIAACWLTKFRKFRPKITVIIPVTVDVRPSDRIASSIQRVIDETRAVEATVDWIA